VIHSWQVRGPFFITSCLVALSSCDEPAPPAPTPMAVEDSLPPGLEGGRWGRASPNAPRFTAEQEAVAEELSAIGYADGVRAAPAVASVTVHDPSRALEGWNLYVSGHGCEALLVDMQGTVLHRWSYDYDELWPEAEVPADAAGRGKWRRAYLFPNGDLLAIHEGIGMIKLDRDSQLLFEYPGKTHHDVDVLEDGRIWTLGREVELIPRIDPEVPCMDDFLVELDAQGRELQRISVLECLERGEAAELLARMPETKELFHTNAIEVLRRDVAGLPAFAPGNLLISLRHLDAIAVVDPRERKVVWWLTGDFRAQHEPTLLASDNLLLFDNRGGGEASSVLELDPRTGAVVWSYAGTREHPFYSHACGTAWRLANGNTLINESDAGRAFEVTPEGEIVWEFYNPHRGGPEGEYIACLYDLQRIVPDARYDWVAR
jgi:hypothetical protein